MRLAVLRKILNLTLLVLLCGMNGLVWAQRGARPKRIVPPATVKGFIGGESHDAYAVRVRKGQKLVISLSWKKEDDNQASFSVSSRANFFEAEPVKFGQESANGTRWTGRVPRIGRYYIYVVAHPVAHYVLKVTLDK